MSEKKIGVVAHFYMDPEVQGVLSQASERWPHINISDSLAMADRAVKMAEQGCTAIAVLGVDFMSENVRAILDEAGHRDVKVGSQTHASYEFEAFCDCSMPARLVRPGLCISRSVMGLTSVHSGIALQNPATRTMLEWGALTKAGKFSRCSITCHCVDESVWRVWASSCHKRMLPELICIVTC